MIGGFQNLSQRIVRIARDVAIIHRIAGPHRILLLAALSLSFLTAAADGLVTVAAVVVLDAVTGGTMHGIVGSMREISGIANKEQAMSIGGFLLIAATLVLRQILTGGANSLTQLVGARIGRHARVRIVSNLIDAPFPYLDQLRSGALRQIVMNEVGAVMRSAQSFVAMFGGLFGTLIALAVLLSISPLLTAIFALAGLAILPVKFVFFALMHRREKEVLERSLSVSDALNEIILGVRQIKLLNRQEEFKTLTENETRQQATAQYRSSLLQTWDPIVVQVATIGLALGIFILNTLLRLTDTTILVAFVFALYRLLAPIVTTTSAANRIVSYHTHLLAAATHYDLNTRKRERDDGSHRDLSQLREIRFQDVRLRYNKRDILNGVILHARRGELIGIVGPSGAGKSSIIGALLGSYPIDQGTILFDDLPSTKLSLASIRGAVGVVSQDVHLFNTSISEVIRGGKSSLDDEAIRAAANRAAADDFITAQPAGYETAVGERGVRLSGGERQRLLLAQCFARGTPVIVLDEATSAVDPLTEQQILMDLDQQRKDCVVIFITHRVQNLRYADRIYFIDHGAVQECGTWDELVKARGRLWAMMASPTGLELQQNNTFDVKQANTTA